MRGYQARDFQASPVTGDPLLSLDRPGVIPALLLSQLVVLLPLLFYLPSWISFTVCAVLMWRLLAARQVLPLPPRWLLVLLTLAAATAVFLYFGTISGREAGVSLVAIMFSLKLLEARHYRDALLIISVSFFVMVTGFLFNQSWLMGAYLLAAVFVILACLVVVNSLRGLTGLKSMMQMSGTVLLLAIPLMMVLFVFFPRLPGPLWRLPTGQSAGSGISDQIAPGDIASLHLSDEVAFRVSFDDGAPPGNGQYWRGLVMTDFDGLAWRPGRDEAVISAPPVVAGEGLVNYEVTLEPHRQRWLFLLEKPLTGPPAARRYGDLTWQTLRPVREKLKYRASSINSLVTDPAISPGELERNLALPGSGNDRARNWARDLRSRHDNDQELVEEILSTINREEFYYTLQPPVLEEDIIDSFWFGSRRGFCEHYASALAFLVRAAGIPARLVAGYQGGEYNPYGDYWIFRQSDAHAWTEVYLAGKGWRRVDPTAAIAPFRVEQDLLTDQNRRDHWLDDMIGGQDLLELPEGVWQKLRLSLDTIDAYWDRWVLSFDNETQNGLLRALGFEQPDLRLLIWLMCGGFLLVLGVAGIGLFRRRPEGDAIARSYRVFCRKLAKSGFEKQLAEGPADFVRRVIAERPELAGRIVPVNRLYIRLRYQTEAARPEDIRRLREQVRQLNL